MEHNEHMSHEAEVTPKKRGGAKKMVIGAVIIGVAIVVGAYVFMKGNPFSSEAVIPATMPEALREVTSNKAVAKVNGEKIDRTTYNNMLASVGQVAVQQGMDLTNASTSVEIKRAALTNVINNYLLQQAAKAAGNTGTDEAVEAQIQSVVTQLGGEEAYTKALTDFGITDEKYRETIKSQIALNEYIENTLHITAIEITDEEIAARYNQVVAQAGENAGTLPKLEEAKEQVRGLLRSEKQEALVSAHLEELRAKADIKEFLTF